MSDNNNEEEESLSSGSFIVEPLTEPPAFLGGLPHGVTDVATFNRGERLLPPSLPLSLPRPAALPKSKAKSKKLAKDCWTARAFMQFWEGTFQVDWEHKENEHIRIKARMLENNASSVGIPEEHRDTPHLMEIRLVPMEPKQHEQQQDGLHFRFHQREFQCSLTDKKQTALALRILYRTIRSHGARLPWNAVGIAVHCVKAHYGGTTKDYGDLLLDAAIAVCDIAVNTNKKSSDIFPHLIYVGRIMETQGKFQQAAKVYEHVALHYDKDDAEGGTFWSSVALAYRRDGDYVRAEEYSIKSLYHYEQRSGSAAGRSRGKSWSINDKGRWRRFTVIVLLYIEIANASAWQYGTEKERRDTQMLLPALSALLSAAEFEAKDKEGMKEHLDKASEFVDFLKARYSFAAGAKKALKAAAMCSDVPRFRATLAACMCHSFYMGYDPNPRAPPIDRQANVDDAREYTESAYEDRRLKDVASPCQNRACPIAGTSNCYDNMQFMSCPCKAVTYCSKGCQEADWKEHKKYCMWLAKKKAAKKNGKGGGTK